MREKLKPYVLIMCGTAITAMAISLFFVPNKIVNGGASGLATVIYYTMCFAHATLRTDAHFALLRRGIISDDIIP